MKKYNTKKTALLGLLFALAMVLSFFEGALSPLLGLPPGVKPGLANIVVMYAFLYLGKSHALVLVVLKAMFGMLTRGATAGLLSLGGGLLSLFVLMLLCLIKRRPTMLIISSTSAIFHNIGQLIVLSILVSGNLYTLYYMPVLLISGLVMGGITSLSLNAVLPALVRLGFRIEK